MQLQNEAKAGKVDERELDPVPSGTFIKFE